MGFLEISLIFLIFLLSIFLAITGFQVFFILRDLKKALDKLNKVLQTSEETAEDQELPVVLKRVVKKNAKPKPRRFYKKTL